MPIVGLDRDSLKNSEHSSSTFVRQFVDICELFAIDWRQHFDDHVTVEIELGRRLKEKKNSKLRHYIEVYKIPATLT
jgi:hypothetical protein